MDFLRPLLLTKSSHICSKKWSQKVRSSKYNGRWPSAHFDAQKYLKRYIMVQRALKRPQLRKRCYWHLQIIVFGSSGADFWKVRSHDLAPCISALGAPLDFIWSVSGRDDFDESSPPFTNVDLDITDTSSLGCKSFQELSPKKIMIFMDVLVPK